MTCDRPSTNPAKSAVEALFAGGNLTHSPKIGSAVPMSSFGVQLVYSTSAPPEHPCNAVLGPSVCPAPERRENLP